MFLKLKNFQWIESFELYIVPSFLKFTYLMRVSQRTHEWIIENLSGNHLISHDIFCMVWCDLTALSLAQFTQHNRCRSGQQGMWGPDQRCCLVLCYIQDVVICSKGHSFKPWKPNLNIQYTDKYQAQHCFNWTCMNLFGKLFWTNS